MIRTNAYIATLLCGILCLLAACDKELQAPDVVPETGTKQAPITFQVSGLATRSAIDSTKHILSLGLFGYSTGTTQFDLTNPEDRLPNLIYNQEAKRESAANNGSAENTNPWTYSPPAYWPADESVNNSFFAYSPHLSTLPTGVDFSISAQTDTGYPKLRYAVPEYVADQVDILYATGVKDVNRTLNGTGKVNYTMKHALTWLVFFVMPESEHETDKVKIKSLRFVIQNLMTKAELNLGTGGWRNLVSSSEAEYEFDLLTDSIPAKVISPISPASSHLMLIPQNVTQAANPSAIEVVFAVSNDPNEYFYAIPFPDTKLSSGSVSIYLIRLSTKGARVEFVKENTIEKWKAATIEIPPINVL